MENCQKCGKPYLDLQFSTLCEGMICNECIAREKIFLETGKVGDDDFKICEGV